MGKSRNHIDYDETYYERPIQKKKWYEDEVIIEKRKEKVKLPEDFGEGLPLEYYD